MKEHTQAIVESALQLSASERVEIIEELLESLEPPGEADTGAVRSAWEKEAARRASELDSGAVKPVPWEEVEAEGERLLRGDE